MKRSRHLVIVLLIVSLVFSSMLSSAFAAAPKDVEKHWAADTLNKWVDASLIKGYPDGTLKPNAPVKRGEFVALLNRALKLSSASTQLSFSDLAPDHWAYQDIAIAVNAGYLKGSAGKVNPDQNTFRQEAAVMIASALQLDTQSGGDVSQFGDVSQIANWSKGAIAVLAAHNVFKGDTKGNLRPKANITRAEAVVAIDAALSLQNKADTVFDKAGVYGTAEKTTIIKGNVVISADGVTLQNTIINGDLTIAKEVGDGDVILKKVTVKGTTNVNGGGEHSVHLEDSIMLRIIVDKASGKVRIVAIGSTTVQDVIINTSAKLEESNVTDSGFANIELSKALPQGAGVDLIGQFEDVSVMAVNIQVNIPSGSVNNLHVGEGAANNTINISKEAQVLKLVLDAVSKLIGEGKIESATVSEKAQGSSFETKPTKIDGDIPITPPVSGYVPPNTVPNEDDSNEDNSNEDNSDEDNSDEDEVVCTVDCRNATLNSMSVTSSVYEQFELVQRSNDRKIIGTGFSGDALAYSVEVPRDIVEADTAINVTAGTYATISYSIMYDNGDYEWGSLAPDQTSFNMHLKPLHDASVYISVNSGDHISTKSYRIDFYYTRNLQEAFRIENHGNDAMHPQYQLVSQSLEDGDKVTVTLPAADTSNNMETSVTRSTYGSANVYLSNFVPSNLQGAIHVKVTRNDQLIMDGDYQYDFSPLAVVADGSGIDVQLMTKQQLQEFDAQSHVVGRSSYGFEISFHTAEITDPALKNAKYMSINWSDIRNSDTEPRIWTKEDIKISYNKFTASFAVKKISNDSVYRHYFLGRNEVYNQYVYVFGYDENRNIIGYHVYTVNFDTDHVGDFVTIVPPTPTLP